METGLLRKGKLAGGLGLLLALALIASLAMPALAAEPPPPIPEDHKFWGSVTVCGELAEEGTVVTATIDGVADEWTSVVVYIEGWDGFYGLNDPPDYPENFLLVPADDPGTPGEKEGGVEGDTVQFWVLGQLAGQATFVPDTTTRLDLEVCGEDVELTVVASPPEGGVVTGSGTYAYGFDAPITATEAGGWDFVGWTTDDMDEIADSNSPSTTVYMDKDKTVTANFVEEGVTYYTLTMAVTGSGTTTPAVGDHLYPADEVVDITATPDAGWEFVDWTGDVAEPDSATTIVTMDADKTITANFSVLKVSYVLTMNAEGGGAVTPESGTYPEGDITITATSASGWRFAGWSTDDIAEIADPASPSTTLTLDKDKTVTATFTERVGFTTPLFFDWNLVSTPITLDADSDTLGQIFDAESVNNILIFYRWDAVVTENWVQIFADYELLPLEAIYVKVKPDASAIAEFIPSGELTWPPTRDLVEGLNLIGPAPELEDGVFPAMPLDQALISIALVPGDLTGYTMVISPDHNQEPWTYPPWEIENLLPYKGYWVFMLNAGGTLVGFSTTP